MTIDPITEYILDKGWPDEYYGHKLKDAHTKFGQKSSLGIMKCEKKFKKDSREELLCSHTAEIIADKAYLKWVQRKGPRICKRDDTKCQAFVKNEIIRMSNIINKSSQKIRQLQKK